MSLLFLHRAGIGLTLAVSMASQIATARCEDVTVTIDNFTFTPAELTVRVGATVTWKNQDDIPHTVTSPGKFKSKALDTDDSYSFTFTATGDYRYFCSLHPHMTGIIKVE